MPPPATAGPPLGLALMAIAEAVPSAVISPERQAATRISPPVERTSTSVGGRPSPVEGIGVAEMNDATLLSMSLRARLRPTEIDLEPPL